VFVFLYTHIIHAYYVCQFLLIIRRIKREKRYRYCVCVYLYTHIIHTYCVCWFLLTIRRIKREKIYRYCVCVCTYFVCVCTYIHTQNTIVVSLFFVMRVCVYQQKRCILVISHAHTYTHAYMYIYTHVHFVLREEMHKLRESIQSLCQSTNPLAQEHTYIHTYIHTYTYVHLYCRRRCTSCVTLFNLCVKAQIL
jgi:hypothetical protein